MDQIEYPDFNTWEDRRAWFDEVFDIETRGGGYIIGEQASALLIDLQAVYCAGAFVTCLILACTIVDAHLREAELRDDFEGGMRAAFKASEYQADLEWLRKLRNRLVHFEASHGPALTVDDHYQRRATHEADAEKAIELVADVLFEHPWA